MYAVACSSSSSALRARARGRKGKILAAAPGPAPRSPPATCSAPPSRTARRSGETPRNTCDDGQARSRRRHPRADQGRAGESLRPRRAPSSTGSRATPRRPSWWTAPWPSAATGSTHILLLDVDEDELVRRIRARAGIEGRSDDTPETHRDPPPGLPTRHRSAHRPLRPARQRAPRPRRPGSIETSPTEIKRIIGR